MFKKLLSACLLTIAGSLALVGCTINHNYGLIQPIVGITDLAPVAQQTRQVVGLYTDGLLGSCSMVVIAPGLALTAAHCQDLQLTKGFVKMEDGQTYEVAGLVPDPTGRDLAVMHIPEISCPCAEMALYPARMDEAAVVVGYPLGIGQIITTGFIQSRYTSADGEDFLFATTPVAPGNSGGGLFVVRQGKAYLVGILVILASGANHLSGSVELP